MAVGSFSAGLSGLNANATYLSVIGNNLANINTVGFKTSAVSFADLGRVDAGAADGLADQVGLGVVTGAISPVFAQGSIATFGSRLTWARMFVVAVGARSTPGGMVMSFGATAVMMLPVTGSVCV